MIALSVALCLFLSMTVKAVGPVSFSVSDYRDSDAPAQRNINTRSCSSFSARISMIEHFFTLVYNEYEGSPPTCVCVQMCESQPLFCYPNGCLRKEPTYSGNNIKLKFDIATFPPTQAVDNLENRFEDTNRLKYPSKMENRYFRRFNENFPINVKPVTENYVNRNIIVKPVGNEQLLPIDLKYFDKKFKSLNIPLPSTKVMDVIPKDDRYTVVRTDAAGKFLTEEEYQAAEDQFRRHLQVSP